MYLDNNFACKKHVTTLKHKNNVRLNKGEVIKNGDKFDCVTCKTSLTQYSVEKHFKTKTHLDNVVGKDKDLQSSFTGNNITKDRTSFSDICKTRYDNKKKHIESEQHKNIKEENIEEKKLVEEKWRDEINQLGLDHNMKHNKIIVSSTEY